MSDSASPEEYADILQVWLEENDLWDAATARGFASFLGRATTSGSVIEKVAVEIYAQVLPWVIGRLRDNTAQIGTARLRAAAELLRDVQDWAHVELQTDLSVVTELRAAFPLATDIGEIGRRRVLSTRSLLSIYISYLSLDCVSATLERLLVLAATEIGMGERAGALRPAVVVASDRPLAVSLDHVVGMAVFAALAAFLIAKAWAWLEFGSEGSDTAYAWGWVGGRAAVVFVVLFILGVIGTIRILGAESQRRNIAIEELQNFKASLLFRLHVEVPPLLKLA